MEEKNTQNIKKTSKNNIILRVIIAVVIVLLSVIGYMYYQSKTEMQGYIDNMTQEKLMLTNEYQDLASNFNDLKPNNDSLNVMLGQEREKISQLLEEIQIVKVTNASQIRKYQKELSSLRSVLKNFVVQIDSLNQRNTQLTKENIAYKEKVSNMQTDTKKLKSEKEKLTHKVNIASKLETSNLEVGILKSNGRKTKRLPRVDKIRICFNIQKNVTAKVGNKTIYLRILRPDGALLFHSRNDVFKYEGEDIYFSSSRTVEYGGDKLDVCLFYKVDSGELIKGEYAVDIFADGRNIGTMSFEL